jgi:hypothetical protein
MYAQARNERAQSQEHKTHAVLAPVSDNDEVVRVFQHGTVSPNQAPRSPRSNSTLENGEMLPACNAFGGRRPN